MKRWVLRLHVHRKWDKGCANPHPPAQTILTGQKIFSSSLAAGLVCGIVSMPHSSGITCQNPRMHFCWQSVACRVGRNKPKEPNRTSNHRDADKPAVLQMLAGPGLGGQILQTVVLNLFSSLLSITFFSFSYVPSNSPEVRVGGWFWFKGSGKFCILQYFTFSTKVYLEDRVSL